MPWHSNSTKDAGVEVSVHYRLSNGNHIQLPIPGSYGSGNSTAAAILTIDANNVNIIGPASIAQRLMLAAMSVAAAAPAIVSSNCSSGTCDQTIGHQNPRDQDSVSGNSEDKVSSDEDTVDTEKVAKAFLDSVDKYFELDETSANSPSPFELKNFWGENVNFPPPDENLQVVFIAPRPRQNSSHKHRRKSSKSSTKTRTSVRLLSIDSFGQKSMSVDSTDETCQRILSIPDVLLNVTSVANDLSTTPRSRVVNFFANHEQSRPVFAPRHPVDLEGLQETAV